MKILNKTSVSIIVLVLALIAVSLYATGIFTKGKTASQGKFSGMEKNLTEIDKDINFYKYFDSYISLLDEQEYNYVNDKLQSFADSEDAQNLYIIVALNELFKDDRIKNDFMNIRDKISQTPKDQSENIFQKNTTCGNLVSDLQNQLKNKYKINSNEKEEFQFIFYSPNLNTCVYTTKYIYSYNDLTDWEKSYSKNLMMIYNASTNIKIKEFTVYYSYNYPYLSKDEADGASEKDTMGFKKFILENSNYNIDLIKDQSYF